MNGPRGLIIATAAAFIVGCSVGLMGGILFARFAVPGPPGFVRMRGGPPPFESRGARRRGGPERLLPMLERALSLTPEQRERIVAILDRSRKVNEAARDSMEAEISRVLTPGQRTRWKQMEETFRRSRRTRSSSGGPAGTHDSPNSGERIQTMRTGWWSMSVAALMAIAPMATPVYAQEGPPPEERAAPEGDVADDLELDWLAADIPGGREAAVPRRGGRPGQRARMRADGLREKLNLSDDQRRRLADIRDRQTREAIPIQSELRIAQLDLAKLMREERPDTRAIEGQIDRLAELRASMQKARVAGTLEARALLTPTQLKLMREHRGSGRGLLGGPGRRMRMHRTS